MGAEMTGRFSSARRTPDAGQELEDSFERLLQGPYRRHLAMIGELSERSDIVAAISPDVLTALLRDGLASALERYGHALAPATSNLVGVWLEQHIQLAESLKPRWKALPGGTLSGFIRGARAGLVSDEAKVGSAIGSLFGGVGGLVGGVVGSMLALQHEDRDFAQQLESYLAEVDRWAAVLAGDFERRVLPRVERDLNPWPHRIKWAVAALVSLGAIGGLSWMLR